MGQIRCSTLRNVQISRFRSFKARRRYFASTASCSICTWTRNKKLAPSSLEGGPAQILIGNYRDRQRPLYAECWIIVANASGCIRRMKFRSQVVNRSVVGQNLESVRESLRNIELCTVRLG